MITFNVTKDDKSLPIQLETTNTFLELKERIVKEFSCKCSYVDLLFLLERPIRSLGKFNLDKGLFPRTLDKYPLDRYELDEKTIPTTFTEIDDYNPKKLNRVQIQSGSRGRGSGKPGIYVPPTGETFVMDEPKEFTCDLQSLDEFPPL